MTVEQTNSQPTRSSPRGLATVALLKARFDEGVDQIDMFMPLVTDTIVNLPSNDFTAAEVQQLLHQRHGLILPQHTLSTLLKRATRKGIVKREYARYVRQGQVGSTQDLQAKKHLLKLNSSV